jgi:esterase/lipase
MEYPGYGLYVGETGSEKVLSDALYVFDHLTMKMGVSPNDIVIFGRSIGCSPASYLGRHRDPAAILLMSPFKSIRDVAKDLVGRVLSYAIADRFRNIDLIKEIKCAVFIVHG